VNATVQRLLAGIIVTFGLLVTLGYVLAIVLASSRPDATDQWGALAGFALFSVVVGIAWLLALVRQRRQPNDGSTGLPPAWLSFAVFAIVVGIGFGSDFVERGSYFAPLLTILGFAAVGAFFLRLAVSWMPEHKLPLRNVVMSGAWGVFIAPLVLMVFQGLAVAFILVAGIAGILLDNPDFELDPNLGDRVTAYIEESGTSATSTKLPDIVESPTIALALFSVVAVIAPLSEELVKALGAILVLSRREVVTRTDAFLAAVASSLGFALFEGVGYTLGAGTSWHTLILVRAPVVIMHLAATTIVVMGWYRMRETGRGFLPYFVTGTALHAGWNALSVGFIYSLTGMEAGTDPSAGQALGIMAMILLLGTLFVAALAWFVSTARKAGLSARRSTLAQQAIDQSQPSYAAILGA
jgi:RsiW-degrading membrane proteinase PrsW (M82 family)